MLSYVIALLAVVPLSKLLLDKVQGGASKTFVDRFTEEVSAKFAEWSLRVTLANRHIARLWTLGAIALFVCSIILFAQLPSSLFPDSEGRKLSINVELPPAATLERSQEVANRIGEIVRRYSDPDGARVFESVLELVGQRSNLVASSELKPGNADYFVGLSAIFVARHLRARDSFAYTRELRQELNDTGCARLSGCRIGSSV